MRIDCHYPDCRRAGTHQFALVPLCEQHREDIRHETAKFYGRKGDKDEMEHRPIYMSIAQYVPWSKPSLDDKRKKVEKVETKTSD